MLIKSLEVTTDKVTENVLMATVTLREVIISSTHTIQVADKANMTQGQNTAPVKTWAPKRACLSLTSRYFPLCLIQSLAKKPGKGI